SKKFFSILIYITTMILLTPQLLGGLIEKFVLPYMNVLEYYLGRIPDQGTIYFSIGKIVFFLLFLITVINRDFILKYNKSGELFYKLTISYFYFLLLAAIPTMFRLSLFLAPFFYLSLSVILTSQFQFKILIKYFIISYFIFSPIS